MAEQRPVVNEAAARLLWRGESAIGKNHRGFRATYTIAGVARDVHYTAHESIGPLSALSHFRRQNTERVWFALKARRSRAAEGRF
jgi:hypothetical protein